MSEKDKAKPVEEKKTTTHPETVADQNKPVDSETTETETEEEGEENADEAGE